MVLGEQADGGVGLEGENNCWLGLPGAGCGWRVEEKEGKARFLIGVGGILGPAEAVVGCSGCGCAENSA